jgi:DNA-binding MarR family transcriptional regulator
MIRQYQETAGLLIGDIARMMRVRFHDRARHLGLTRAQWTLLNRVSHNDGINQSKIAELLEVDVVTVSRLIDGLAVAGWLERRIDMRDRRIQRIHVTKDAFMLLDQLDALGQATEREALEGLDDVEVHRLRSALSLVRQNLSNAIASKNRRDSDAVEPQSPRRRKSVAQ